METITDNDISFLEEKIKRKATGMNMTAKGLLMMSIAIAILDDQQS